MSFSFKDRESALTSLSNRIPELLVIGAGVVGCSIAAHAARLGMDVVVIEKEDLASGASGNSTGLAHAGLRYLAQGRIGYVFHESRERARLEELAPQWVRPFDFVLPVYESDPFPFWQVRLGTWMYDALGWLDAVVTRRPLVRRHRRLSLAEVTGKIPGIKTEGLLGGIEYYVDARLQDTRFTLGFAQQAAEHGARFITHCDVTAISTESANPTVSCTDRLTKQSMQVSAKLVINATGAWIDELQARAGLGGQQIQKSKGIHLVVDRVAESPLIFSAPVKGKVFFVIPVGMHRSLVGTTDTPVTAPVDTLRPDARDVSELLQQLFYFFPALKQGPNLAKAMEAYTAQHVKDVYWGVRPLLFQEGSTLSASREHKLIKGLPAFWSLPGVKLTAARAAGEEAASEAWEYTRRGVPVPSVEWDVLPGGDFGNYRSYVDYAKKQFKLGANSDKLIPYLISMYGTRYMEVVQWAQREPRFAEAVLPEEPWILAEAVYAVHEEMALTLNDFLWRRTKWAHWRELPDPAVRKIIDVMGGFLSWSDAERQRQLDDYHTEHTQHRLHGHG